MDYKTAFDILEIDVNKISYQEITHSYLKTKYHKLALLNHPDKNGNTPESNERFQKINEAYIYLDKEINNLNGIENTDQENNYKSQEDIFKNNTYKDFVNIFIANVIDGRYNDLIKTVIKEILIVGCKNISLKLFEDLDKESSFNVYNFLSKHRFLFHLNEENMCELREKLLQKYSNVVIYKLNPSIDDLMDNNLYKLYVDGQLYLVPLWHNELYYDGSGCEIIAICEPELPNSIKIDEDNNICIEKYLKINQIYSLFGKNIQVQIGKRTFFIPTENLQIKREQLYTIKQEGLAQIKENDIYDVSKRTDIIVKIIFE
jgi:hypothetical protein